MEAQLAVGSWSGRKAAQFPERGCDCLRGCGSLFWSLLQYLTSLMVKNVLVSSWNFSCASLSLALLLRSGSIFLTPCRQQQGLSFTFSSPGSHPSSASPLPPCAPASWWPSLESFLVLGSPNWNSSPLPVHLGAFFGGRLVLLGLCLS